MKKIYLVTTIAVFLLFCSKGIQSQTTQPTLNQLELMKRFIGRWKCEYAKDTTLFIDYKSYGTGIEGKYKYVTKGKIIIEGKQLFGYDTKLDKFIMADMYKGMDMILYGIWFTSDEDYVFVPLNDISDPENSLMVTNGEFKSPDLYIETLTMNTKIDKSLTYSRVKKY